MATLYMRLWWMVAAVLLCSPQIHSRNVTNEDIRDAMLSLVRMFRNSEDQLERHEFREKALGDQMKKLVIGIDKRQRALEPVKGMVSRLDERLSNVETLLLQKEKSETANQEKINKALDEIQKSLQDLTSTVTNLKPQKSNSTEDNLTTIEDPLTPRLDAIDAKVDAVKMEIVNLKNSFSKENLRAMCLDVASDVNPLEKHISEAEKLLNKYELKLNEYGNSSKVQTEFVPLSDVTLADEAWHSKMTEVMERQEKDVQKIQKLLSDAESMWKEIPRIKDIQEYSNRTLEAIEKGKSLAIENNESVISKLTVKLREMNDRLLTTNEDIQKSLTQGNTLTESVYSEITRSYDLLRNELKTLAKNEHVLVQTADNVDSLKKRIEYGVHRIMSEVGDLVKVQNKILNRTVHERVEDLEKTIVENQIGSLTNITSKIETEMSQVWRQISVMYQQLTENKITLETIEKQTETYVSNSTDTMTNMNGKIGLITEHMATVDDNLNFLLGRLSLITRDFNKIKIGLGEALDQMRDSFHTIRSKVNDHESPGPHNITD